MLVKIILRRLVEDNVSAVGIIINIGGMGSIPELFPLRLLIFFEPPPLVIDIFGFVINANVALAGRQ